MRTPLFKHWTEGDKRVLAFVEQSFGEKAKANKKGADLTVGKLRVEVKAAAQWCVTNCANGGRRQGRFRIARYNEADFFVFVLVRGKKQLEFCAMSAKKVYRQFGKSASVRWSQVFA